MATTTNYGWTKPTVSGSSDTWGTENNAVIDAVDSALHAVSVVADAALPKAGGTMTQPMIGPTPTSGAGGYASWRAPHGTAPTTNLTNGDFWTTTAAPFIRLNGTTHQFVLAANNLPALQPLFHAFFASIPHDWYRNSPIAQYEGYCASIFYSHFAALGVDIRLEDATNQGRIDMTVLFNGHVYIFEFKVVNTNATGSALQQIKDRGYADKYRARGEPIHLIGVEFSKDSRNIVAFEVEALV